MDAAFRRIIFLVLLALALLIPACTRERPAPAPTSTPSFDSAAPTAIQVTDTPPAVDGEPTSEPAQTETPEPDTAASQQTPDQTFQYPVQPGDTLLSIAIKYNTDVETIRELNALDSDNIVVGQPLYLPFVEGMTFEGMPTATPGPYAYTIQPGDTLGAIALRFNADPIEIIEYNNLLAPDNLTVGTEIIIPNYQPPGGLPISEGVTTGAGSDSGVSDGSVIHTVAAGEGLFEIADIYGVSPNEIAIANNMNDTNLLRVGQQLIIPGVSPLDAAASCGSIHVVQSGESLLGIAIRYGVTVDEVLTANDLSDPDAIFEGQELIIPGS